MPTFESKNYHIGNNSIYIYRNTSFLDVYVYIYMYVYFIKKVCVRACVHISDIWVINIYLYIFIYVFLQKY